MTKQLEYELFVRGAFEYVLGKFPDRAGDPAGLADTTIFSDIYLPQAKAATAYAMEIYCRKIEDSNIDEDEKASIEGFTGKAIDAESLSDLSDLIDEFNIAVVNKYFRDAN